jgi:hypothetical protein
LTGLQRTLESTSARTTAAATVFTARMNESGDGSPRVFTSWVSLLWVRQGESWRLTEARLVSNGALQSSERALQGAGQR